MGGNLDALFDGFAGNYALQPPFTVVIRGAAQMPPGEWAHVRRAAQVFADARAEFGIEVALSFTDEEDVP